MRKREGWGTCSQLAHCWTAGPMRILVLACLATCVRYDKGKKLVFVSLNEEG